MKSLRDEIPLRGEKDAADLISSEALAEDFIQATLGFHRALRDFIDFHFEICYNIKRGDDYGRKQTC